MPAPTLKVGPPPESQHGLIPGVGSPALTAPLTAADRCDYCGAQAYVRATLMKGDALQDILFCKHHSEDRDNRSKIEALPSFVYWHDETARLLERAEGAEVH